MTKLTIITGPMFAGKSTKLLTFYNNLIPYETLVFNHSFDNRYNDNDVLTTHNGDKLECIKINDSKMIYNKILEYTEKNINIKNIIIDECQFFNDIDVIINLISNNIKSINNIICAGLDLDAKGKIFNSSFTKLFTLSDELIILKSKCYICNEDAKYSICLNNYNFKNNNILVGNDNIYRSSCKLHINY